MSKIIKIGFDAKRLFSNKSGLGNYSRSIVKALSHHYPTWQFFLYAQRALLDSEVAWISNRKNIFIRTPKRPVPLWRQNGIVKDMVDDDLDIYHGLSGELPLSIDKCKIKSVVTIHDCIFQVYPRFYSAVDRNIYNFKWKNAIGKADHIICVSQSTLSDTQKFYKKRDDKLYSVIPPIVEVNIPLGTYSTSTSSPYLIFIGTGNKRKNLSTLLEALNILNDRGKKKSLVVVGEIGPADSNYLDQYKLKDQVSILSEISTVDLYRYLAAADALVYPSLYEGFGIPIVEALHLGTSVITTSSSGMIEAGAQFVTYLNNPLDASVLADTIQNLDKTYDVRHTALMAHLDTFNPTRIASSLATCYTSLLSSE